MVRYYVVQGSHPAAGWIDLKVAAKKEKPCVDRSEEYTKTTGQVSRVVRKPKGWVPSEDWEVL